MVQHHGWFIHTAQCSIPLNTHARVSLSLVTQEPLTKISWRCGILALSILHDLRCFNSPFHFLPVISIMSSEDKRILHSILFPDHRDRWWTRRWKCRTNAYAASSWHGQNIQHHTTSSRYSRYHDKTHTDRFPSHQQNDTTCCSSVTRQKNILALIFTFIPQKVHHHLPQ